MIVLFMISNGNVTYLRGKRPLYVSYLNCIWSPVPSYVSLQFFQSNILLLAKSVNCICPFCKEIISEQPSSEFRQHCRLSICRICRIVCQILITESEANPNYNLMMRREACLAIIRPVLSSFVDKSEKHDPTVER